ncbi:competence protein ComEA [Phycicoccus duodecadis]|uniref:Competence protein ComEA n=1 Tax=Phycicoccus duodecadis TaxID=173053 RepID=A0A2N3YFY0_9MICO|nr:competence protein ComEA [Phycicoccus duodecadis]
MPSREVLGLGEARGDVDGGARDDGDAFDDDPGRHRGSGARAWVRAPAALVGARWQPGRAAVLGVLLVTLAAVLVLGLRVAWARSDDGDVVAPAVGGSGAAGVERGAVPVGVPASASPSPSVAPSASPSGSGAAVVVVHVVGQVVRGGLYRLPPGSRVADAVEAAGGATRAADLGALNLARVLVDGEQVRVPRPGEVVAAGPVTGGAGGGAGGGGGSGGAGAVVSLNAADAAALDSLPGIGPVIAQRIVDWRTEHGRFTSVDELAEVSGIGEKLLAQVRPLVTT